MYVTFCCGVTILKTKLLQAVVNAGTIPRLVFLLSTNELTLQVRT